MPTVTSASTPPRRRDAAGRSPSAALAELGGRPEDVIRTRHFITDGDAEVVDAISSVHGEIFGEIRPASTMVIVAGLIDPRWKVEVELDAVVVE